MCVCVCGYVRIYTSVWYNVCDGYLKYIETRCISKNSNGCVNVAGNATQQMCTMCTLHIKRTSNLLGYSACRFHRPWPFAAKSIVSVCRSIDRRYAYGFVNYNSTSCPWHYYCCYYYWRELVSAIVPLSQHTTTTTTTKCAASDSIKKYVEKVSGIVGPGLVYLNRERKPKQKYVPKTFFDAVRVWWMMNNSI